VKAVFGVIVGIVIALGILAIMHDAHIWTLLGFRYN